MRKMKILTETTTEVEENEKGRNYRSARCEALSGSIVQQILTAKITGKLMRSSRRRNRAEEETSQEEETTAEEQ